jgi:hypothetical protein
LTWTRFSHNFSFLKERKAPQKSHYYFSKQEVEKERSDFRCPTSSCTTLEAKQRHPKMSSPSEVSMGDDAPKLHQLPANEDLIDDAGQVSRLENNTSL